MGLMQMSDIKVSYAILTHNETDSLQKLLDHLFDKKSVFDEIVIVDDYSDNLDTIKIINKSEDRGAKVFRHQLNNHFADQKNFATSKCRNEYIFSIDADEILDDNLIETFKEVLYINPDVDMFSIPRINIVNDITLNHIGAWRWHVAQLPELTVTAKKSEMTSELQALIKSYNLLINDDGNDILYYKPIINWPDYQNRVYKNNSEIKWHRPIHEFINGHKTYTRFPMEKQYSIIHEKNVKIQENQNKLYQGIYNDQIKNPEEYNKRTRNV